MYGGSRMLECVILVTDGGEGECTYHYTTTVEDMSGTETAPTRTIRVNEGNLKTQLAVVEDGQCYLIDIASSGEAVSLTPTQALLQEVKPEGEEAGENSSNESIPLTFYTTESLNLNPAEGQQVILDDEQARAVANLLEFHNQQNNATGSISVGKSDSGMENQRRDSPEEILPHYNMPRDPLAMETLAKKVPLRTYGKRCPAYMTGYDDKRPVKEKEKNKNPASSSKRPKISFDASIKNPHFILPITSVLSDHMVAPRRKRRFFTDAVTVISPSEFKQQLLDTSDIVQSKIESAPPTKKAMYYLAYGGVGKFFATPGRKVPSVPLAKLFFSRLTMMSEIKPVIGSLQKELAPLDSDLRTPGMKDSIELSASQSHTPYHHLFNDAVAKRTANSFDSLCKGMSKPPKFEYKRKKCKDPDIAGVEEKPGQFTSVKQEEGSILAEPIGEPISQSQKPMMNGTHLGELDNNEIENSGNEIVYTIHEDASLIKGDPHNQPSEIFVVEENMETGGGPSNFEMLIAAAEHHNTLHTSGDQEDQSESETQELEIKVDDEEGPKAGLVYCTNENMEQLIILGANGERYRVTASNQGELTLWPEAECDAN